MLNHPEFCRDEEGGSSDKWNSLTHAKLQENNYHSKPTLVFKGHMSFSSARNGVKAVKAYKESNDITEYMINKI